MTRALLALSCAVLTGCATSPTTLDRRLADRILASLLTCAGRPVPGDLSMQSYVAAFVVDLYAAG